ncbi:MAG: hypothetical protein A2122_00315 [Candidatus Liptonbacteria bacterium GWB1_49_6]|uniref:Carboxypeptidase regulatory-like domain-containing protein n=1 Tax=Candidatus Liptonbacteria bacterium GWB1_49_6 TaxID=1798644 RepID=A0A1G2C5S5_9BACT|nr:MAG: hypothetical protein A2122_00315 [Candidatus Liptonbacteria bacterium GWB1_49_6]
MRFFFPTRIALLILIISVLFIAGMFVFGRREKFIAGRVVDCQTGAPIGSAEVSVDQRGWGIQNGQVIWDKDYIYTTHTDQDGRFALRFKVGANSVNLIAKFPSYLRAQQYERPDSDTVLIRMLVGSNPLNEPTENCIPFSQRQNKVQTVP